MNLLKQVEPLKQAALQASSLQRHAHHAASRLTWVNIGSTSNPPSRAKQGTETLYPSDPNGYRLRVQETKVSFGFL